MTAGAGAIGLDECLKDAGLFLCRDADSGIGNANVQQDL